MPDLTHPQLIEPAGGLDQPTPAKPNDLTPAEQELETVVAEVAATLAKRESHDK